MKHRLLSILAGLLAALGLVISIASTVRSGYARPLDELRPYSDKIAPWVIEHTADGAPAEFLIVLADQADLSGAAALPSTLEKGRYVRDALWNTAQSTQRDLLAWLAARGAEYRSYYIVNLVWVRGDRDLALALAARPDVARVEGNPQIMNLKFPTLAAPFLPTPAERSQSGGSSPLATAGIEPNIAYVRAPEVWAMGFTGQGIVVGGQDTGYDWTHPALTNQYRPAYPGYERHDFNWHDSIHSGGGICGANSPQPCDDYGHGTHTMGTAVGRDGANQIGAAPGAAWIGCRNMNQGVGTPATYLECFEFFLAPYPVNGTPAQGDPAKAPDVTVNSWTCPSDEGCAWDTLQAAVEAHRAAGIMTVASAGNEGPGCSSLREPPSIYAAAYTVGALITGQDVSASFSNHGPVTVDGSYRRKPDIAAPGTGIRSSRRGGGYTTLSGTSMASPHVAGAVALLWSARPALRNQITATEHVLGDFAVHIPSTECGSDGWPNNVYGYGRLDAKAAVDMIGTLVGTVRDGDTGSPLEARVQASGPWLTLQTTTTATGQYTFTLPAGAYTLTATYNGYGYYAVRRVGVPVPGQLTTTLDLMLTPYERFVVSGRLSDAVSGQALGGTVTFTGPVSIPAASASPGTGLYSAQLMSGTYTLMAVAQEHWPVSRTIGVYGDQVQDFKLPPCVSPGPRIKGVDFTWTPQPATAGRTITFTSVVTGGVEPFTYEWGFMPGSLLVPGRQTLTHTLAEAGTYSVTLHVKDACSAAATTHPVKVQALRTLYLPLVGAAWGGQSAVVRIAFSPGGLNELAGWLDIWEVNHQAGYVLAMVTPAELEALAGRGYAVQFDEEKTRWLHTPRAASQVGDASSGGIPGYSCYRTVEETEATLQALADAYPGLTTLTDLGDSWEKFDPGGAPGYDLWELAITNQDIAGPKPRLFVLAEVHAREYATAELATRFAEYLLRNYGQDPDVTWIVDYVEIHIVPMANPDGRKLAEQGYYQRKNTNDSSGSWCFVPPAPDNQHGVDLNRNSSFKWGGASSDPCQQTYQGRWPVSEPEVQAIQERVSALFPDQRGLSDFAAAPDETSGVFITLHSYSQFVLFPWSWASHPAPNAQALQTLGRKFGYFNRYAVCQAGAPDCFYRATGANDDWAYGELGVAAYTFEMGTAFFQDCASFESTVYPRNLQALLYAARVARAPYLAPAGPDVLTPSVSLSGSLTGLAPVTLTAIADDSRYYSNGRGNEPTQAIAAAEYSIDTPPWASGVVTYSMNAGDGGLDSSVEDLVAVLDAHVAARLRATGGRHLVYVRARDAAGHWGPPSAAWLPAAPPSDSPRLYLPFVMK